MASPAAADEGADALLDLLASILGEVATGGPDRPYYAAIEVRDEERVHLQATHGAPGPPVHRRRRVADVDLRVGSPELDNTRIPRGAGSWLVDDARQAVPLPLDGAPEATRLALWRQLDDQLRAALRTLEQLRGSESVQVLREDASADFAPAEPVVDHRPPAALELDEGAWQAVLDAASAAFLDHPAVQDSSVSLEALATTTRLATSEGTSLRFPDLDLRLSLWARTVAEDGTVLELTDHVDAASPERLWGPETLEARVHALARRLEALREAPRIEPVTVPAILTGRAAGVFFHEVLGHRVEGHRQKDEQEGQTFRRMVGSPILPSFLSVVDDPTLAELGGEDLSGHYLYDDEGVPAERVQVVEQGVLRGFLLSRTPIEGFPRSNGHGRRQPGRAVVARQGNLLVQADEVLTWEALRGRLVEEVRRQGRPFGLLVRDIGGGFTLTGRVVPNAFNVRALEVWKVFPDGRPDELVRGGDLIGTPLVAFGRILAAGGPVEVFNGVCGAESGWVPVSASSPAILLSEIEVQRKEKGTDRPPVLPPPEAP